MQIDRGVCVVVSVCVCVRACMRAFGGSCLCASVSACLCVLCECGVLRKNGSPGLLHDKSGSAGPCTRTARECELRVREQTCGWRGEDIDRLHLLPPTTWPPDQTLKRTFSPREMLTGMKTKQCPITLTLNRHNHTKVSAGNLSMVHAKPIGHCMRLVATYPVNISRKIFGS